MDRLADLKSDFDELAGNLRHVIAMLDDRDSKLNGSDAAAIVRERRLIGELLVSADPSFDVAGPLRADYDLLGEALTMAAGASSAVVVRERRAVSARLEQLESPEEQPYVDQLAERRAQAKVARPPSRRRLPRGGA